ARPARAPVDGVDVRAPPPRTGVGPRLPVRHRLERAPGHALPAVIATPSQTVGPFFSFGLVDANLVVAPGDMHPVRIEGRVLDGAGAGVPDAVVEILGPAGFGRCLTAADGRYRFAVTAPRPRRAWGGGCPPSPCSRGRPPFPPPRATSQTNRPRRPARPPPIGAPLSWRSRTTAPSGSTCTSKAHRRPSSLRSEGASGLF